LGGRRPSVRSALEGPLKTRQQGGRALARAFAAVKAARRGPKFAADRFKTPFLSILSCPVLSCPILSCPVLSCPARHSPTPPRGARRGAHRRRRRERLPPWGDLQSKLTQCEQPSLDAGPPGRELHPGARAGVLLALEVARVVVVHLAGRRGGEGLRLRATEAASGREVDGGGAGDRPRGERGKGRGGARSNAGTNRHPPALPATCTSPPWPPGPPAPGPLPLRPPPPPTSSATQIGPGALDLRGSPMPGGSA
jgi:hypothetical protein